MKGRLVIRGPVQDEGPPASRGIVWLLLSLLLFALVFLPIIAG